MRGVDMALTAAQEEILNKARQRDAQQSQYQDVAGNPWFRTAMQGATLGWADEIEAVLRSIPSLGQDYPQIRDEVRAKLAAYKQANPNSALSLELAGALVPSLGALIFTGGAAAPAVATSLGRAAGIGALEGAAQGLGASEAKTLKGQLADTGVGAVTGGLLGPAMTVAGRPVAAAAGKFTDFVRTKMGDKASTAVQAELRRLQEKTGKSTEEIIADINNGTLMSDNKSLMAAIKDYVVQGGEAGRTALSKMQGRAGETRQEAMTSLQDLLASGMDSNVVRGFRQGSKELEKSESAAYTKIFQNTPDVVVDQNIAGDMLNAAQTVPGVMDSINAAYGMRKIVPLFVKRENGAIDMVRQPTLQDAELMRRALKSKTTQYYSGAQTDLAPIVDDMEKSLRTKIDDASPELASTRKNWSNIKGASESFDQGRKALTSNVDELEMTIDAIKSDESKFKAFKAGMMDSIRNKVRRSGTTLANLADADKQFGSALRTVLSPEEIAGIERQLTRAGDVAEMAQKMPVTAGSITEPLRRAGKESGQGFSVSDATRVASGDPTVVLDLIGRLVKKETPSLSDKDRMQVIQTIFSRDPNMVYRALTDQTELANLTKMIGNFASAVGSGAKRGAQQQAVQGMTGLLDQIQGNK